MEIIGQKRTEFSSQSVGLVGNIMGFSMNTIPDSCDRFAKILRDLLSLSVSLLSLVGLILRALNDKAD